MRVCILAPEFLPVWGGVGAYSTELVRNLSKHPDMEIHVVTPKRGDSHNVEDILDFFDHKIEIHNISNAYDNFFYNARFQIAVLRRFKKLNERYDFDIVHSMNLVHMPDIFLKFKKTGIPSITTIHTTIDSQSRIDGYNKYEDGFFNRAPVEYFSSLFYVYIKFMENQYLRRSENFIAVSNWIRSMLPEYVKDKVRVVHNGIDIERFSPKRSKYFSDMDDMNGTKILYTGRLLAMKGISTLIDSMKIVLKKEDAHFIFAGDSRIKKSRLKKKLEGISEENYTFMGYVDYEKIEHLYNKVDLFVLPSLTESCPLNILEAMACQLPVVATDVGGIPEIIREGIEGLLVKPGNAEDLAEKISYMIENKKEAEYMALEGRKKVEKRFNSHIMAEKTLGVYEKIIENG